jgi:NAD(P)-dependent dehydrogenase (short-subunit alcohol dehydrogenase family)
MDLSLTDKVALITGASKGLGHAMAQVLSEEGMRVALAARTAAALESLASQLGPDRALALPVDLTDPAAAQRFVDVAIAKFGRIDLVVNNAGATKRGDFLTLTDDDWHAGYELKFHGAVRLCRAAWPHLVKTRGSIVNIAGVGGRTGSAEFTLGGSVNAALMLFTKALADRGTADGVRVNAINPGSIATDRLTKRIQTLAAAEHLADDQAAAQLAARDRIARFGRPREIADAVAFLASDRAAYIHGAILDIDGGLTRAL